MYNKAYEHPLEMFSWQHLTALGVILLAIIAIFFSRKFFIKHKIADRIFRYTLVVLLLFFELVPYFHGGPRSLFGVLIGPYPLCGHMVWFSVIALLSDSERFTKLFYPFAIIGAVLSLFVLDLNCTFPHIRAFQFFFTHGCFLIGTLYFIFTKKINKYTFKDFGNSCLFLFSLSIFTMILANSLKSGNPNYTDPYFILNPPGGLEFFKEALGQIGYTTIYVFLIFLVMLAIWGITYLCTKNRTDEKISTCDIKENKIFNYLQNLSFRSKLIYFITIFGLGTYSVIMATTLNSSAFKIINSIIFFILIISITINEIVYKYKNKYTKNKLDQ